MGGIYGTAVLEKTFIPDKSENKVVFLSGVNCSGDGYYSSDCHSRNCRTFFTKDNAALLEKCTGENRMFGREVNGILQFT
ncbi:MAG: hypothetical protein ACLVEE_01315 [Phocaeicola vulgatus]